MIRSKIGLGCWGFGGNAYGSISIEQSIDVLNRALSHEIDFFDLSNLYGAGRAEIIFGEWLGSLSEKQFNSIKYTTKAGLLPHKGFEMPYDYSHHHLQVEIQRSLERLRRSASIPIFLLHSPPPSELISDTISDLRDRLVDDGLIDEFGVSLRAPSDILLLPGDKIDWVEVNFNLMDLRLIEDDRVIEFLKLHKIKVICRTPLAFGFLTNNPPSLAERTKFDSHLRNWSNEQFLVWEKGQQLYKRKAGLIGLSLEALSLSFCASQDIISHVIPGAMSEAQINSNLAGIRTLAKEEINDLIKIYKSHNFYVQRK